MKNILFLLVFLPAVLFSGCSASKHAVERPVLTESASLKAPSVNFSEQSTWLLGYFNPSRLAQIPYSEWYVKGFDEYQPVPDVIEKLSAIDKSNIDIKIVMGTWCPDSRREVPRFMRIIDLCKFPADNMTFIGVDNAKLSPVGEYEKLDIHRVPTFIISKNKIETGRIIENPVTSLEQDLLNILTRNE